MEMLKRPWRVGILQREPTNEDIKWLLEKLEQNQIRVKK